MVYQLLNEKENEHYSPGKRTTTTRPLPENTANEMASSSTADCVNQELLTGHDNGICQLQQKSPSPTEWVAVTSSQQESGVKNRVGKPRFSRRKGREQPRNIATSRAIYRRHPRRPTPAPRSGPPNILIRTTDFRGPTDHSRNPRPAPPLVLPLFFIVFATRILPRENLHIGILVYIDFLKRCPLNAGTLTPHCDLQISLGKTRHVSTCLSMLRRS